MFINLELGDDVVISAKSALFFPRSDFLHGIISLGLQTYLTLTERNCEWNRKVTSAVMGDVTQYLPEFIHHLL